MKTIKRAVAFLLCLTVVLIQPCAVSAAAQSPFAVVVQVLGGGGGTVRAYEEAYPDNLYLSLSDLSRALKGTSKQYCFEYHAADSYFSISTGKTPTTEEGLPATTARGNAADLDLTRSRLFIDGSERRYYTYRYENKDLYMSLTDIQLILDLTATVTEDGTVILDPSEPFAPDIRQLKEEGFFDAVNGILLGDADTGEILFYKDAHRAWPIASLSKLMSYLLLCEAADRGEISFSDTVTVTAESDRISRSADGMIPMSIGAKIPFEEMVNAMLLCSSNEAASSLAAHAAGSSEAFVERMNTRARELGLFTARFYTPNGLPAYQGGSIAAKMQNKMSALDLFCLCSEILARYPRITAVTSQQYATMSTLKYSTSNTNTLVFNLPGVTGLKTGSTNRAGYCVAVSMPVTSGGSTHDVVLVVLGAETPELRGRVSEILLRWAQDYYEQNGFRSAS